MPNISSSTGRIPLVKKSYRKLMSLGEGVNGADFRMVFDYGPLKDHEFLVQTTQLPGIKREVIEGKGPHGIGYHQQGNFINFGEVNGTFKEVISGLALSGIREAVRTKAYFNVTMGLVSESAGGSPAAATCRLEDCWIEMDPADLGVEDGAQIVKPPFILHYNWVDWLDRSGRTLGWDDNGDIISSLLNTLAG